MLGNIPIVFYDVCADDFVKKEAEMLQDNYPQIIVWQDIPGCMEVHESVFRNGEYLAQREIQKWFSNIKEMNQILVGQVDNDFVYKLHDGTDSTQSHY